jgi:primosomal protein N'
MIAEVAFDAPVDHPFSYRVPPGLTVAGGQRVVAPLRGARRVGMVLRVRDGDEGGLKAILGLAERGPVLSPARLQLVEWSRAPGRPAASPARTAPRARPSSC